MRIIDEDTIKKEIVPFLSTGKRGTKIEVPIYQIVMCIIYKLKAGVQWSLLPVKEFIPEHSYSWNSVYHHYSKWSKDGSWEKMWINVLGNNLDLIDLSSIQADGSHTIVKKGGEKVGYQGRKKNKTSNMIFLSDNQGNMLGFSDVLAGNHNDLYQIEKSFEQMFTPLKQVIPSICGLFLNADAGFDSNAFKKICFKNEIFGNIARNKRNSKSDEDQEFDIPFDEELYKRRFVIERANAWLDSFKTILIRFTILEQNLASLHYLAMTVRLLKKKFK